MIEEVKQIFDDIRDAIIEMGGSIGECTSPDEYAEAIKNLQGNNAVLYIPVFQSAAAKPAKPTKQMSSNNPTDYPDGGGTTDGLVDNIGMTYTIVGPDSVYSDGTEPIKVNFEGIEDEKPITRTFMICLELPPDKTMVPSRPVGGTGIVDGINNYLQGPITSTLPDGSTTSDGSTDNVHSDGSFTGMSTGTFLSEDGSQLGDWSIPICINSAQDGKDGQAGRNGVDGSDQEFIYKVFHTKYDAEMAETPYSDPNQDDYVPGPNPNVKGYWCDRPQGIDHDVYPYEVMCSRQKNVTDGTGGPFTHPVLWSAGGEDGMDGDGVEYIFRVATNAEVVEDNNGVYHLVDMGTWPPTCADDCANGYYTVAEQSGYTREELYEIYQQDEWVPGDNATAQELGWDRNGTDDPRDVDVNEPFEFVSIRKEKVNPETGVHEGGGFSSPVLWNKYYVTDAPIFTSFVFCRSTKNLSNMQLSGGTVVNPFPDDQTVDGELIHWYDSVPGPNQYPTEPIRANAPIGMTSSKFGSVDPQEVIVANWQSPRLMTDNKYFNVEYSNSEEIIDPQTGAPKVLPKFDATIAGVYPGRTQPFIDPNDPEGVDETTGRDYCYNNGFGDGSDDVAYPKYMATCSFNDGAWSDGTVTQIRGENSIMVDFTNDRDELLYHEDGTKVSKRDATTYAKLYDGVEEVANPTGAIDVNTTTGVTVANGGAPYITLPSPLSANTVYLRTDGYIVVTGISANATQANVVVKTLIDGVTYSKTFVVVKNVGGNNYYLDFSPGAIVYNTTSGNATDKIPIKVEVKCECYPDGEIKQLPLPTGYSVGIGDDGTLGTSWTDLTHTCNWPVESGKGVKDTTGTIHIKLSKTRNSPIADTLDGPEDIPVSFVEDGGDTEYRYQGNQSATTPPTFTPSGGSNPGSSWSTTVPNRPGDGYFLGCISALKNANGTYGTGGNAVRLTGDTGTPGEDGDEREGIYKYDTSGYNGSTGQVSPGGQASGSDTNKQQADGVPNGWYDNPQGVSTSNKTEYASFRDVTNSGTTKTYGAFQTPIIWSHYGERGVDGDGMEYVFIRSKSSTPPTVSSASADHNGNTYTSDEYLPKASGQQLEQGSYNYECTDEPQGVSSTWLYEGVATRSKAAANSEGVRAWNQYTGTMSLWANFAEKGEDAKDREGVYKRQNTDPGTPPSSGNGEISPPSNRAANGNVAYNNTKDDWVPNGWGDNPQGVTDSATTEGASGRDYDKTNKVGKAFNPCFIGSHYGEQGTDGDGVEYVYIRTNSATPPTITNSSDTYGGKTYLSDDYLPLSSAGRCTDNPTGVTSTAQYEYVATRSKTAPNSEGKRTWTKYTENAAMKLGAKGGEKGENGDDGKNQATVSLYQAGTTAPAVPSAATTYTFSTGVLSGTLGNGSQTMPTVSGDNVCGVTQANAISENATVSIPSASGSTPRQISGQKGAPGAQGAAGAKMRMRDWNTSYDGYQGASGEEWYDIAVYPASNDPSLQNIASNLDRLYRCKQTIMHGSIPSGGTPETLTAYFEKATGFNFVATDLMLARKINANEIEADAVSAGTLMTTNSNGSVKAQGGQFKVLDTNGETRVYIHPGNLEYSTASNSTEIFPDGQTITFQSKNFTGTPLTGDGFTFQVTSQEIASSPSSQLFIGSATDNEILINIQFTPTQNYICYNDYIIFSMTTDIYKQNSQNQGELYGVASGSTPQYYATYTFPTGYQITAGQQVTLGTSGDIVYSIDTNRSLYISDAGTYKAVFTLYVEPDYQIQNSFWPNIYTAQLYEVQPISDQNKIYKSTATASSVLCTEVAETGLQTILSPTNYFKVKRRDGYTNQLELEFRSQNGNDSANSKGIRINANGISYGNPTNQAGETGNTP